MFVGDVLRELGWYLSRRDLEAFLLTDKAYSHFVGSTFQGNGPVRVISFASLTAYRFYCKSDGAEREANGFAGVEEMCALLRNSFVQCLRLDAAKLKDLSIDAFDGLKGSYVLKHLFIDGACSEIAELLLTLTVFCCQKVSCSLQCVSAGDDHSIVGREVMSVFFGSSAVAGANFLELKEIPPCSVRSIADWLHGSPGDVMRNISLRWNGACTFDVVTLVDLLKETFANDRCQHLYEFCAGSKHLDLTGVADDYQENCRDEALEIKAKVASYSRLSIKRLMKEDIRRTKFVNTFDGPKVWEFSTVHDLNAYLVTNTIEELLARSGLIANEVTCKCGRVMELLKKSQLSGGDGLRRWRCTGSCTDAYRQWLTADIRVGSWFKEAFHPWLKDSHLLLKLIILKASGANEQETTTALGVGLTSVLTESGSLARFVEKYDEMWDGNEAPSAGPHKLKMFYDKVNTKYPLSGGYAIRISDSNL